MVEAARALYGVVVLLVIGAYSVVFFRGVNNQVSRHIYSALEDELQKNPYMKKDLEDYKVQLAEQERQKEQMKELEEQAKKIQEQLEVLSKKKMPPVRSPKYVRIEQEDQEEVIPKSRQEPNQSEEFRIEL